MLIRPYMPPRPPDAPAEPEYWQPGVLEELVTEAGLTPETAFGTSWAYEFADEDTPRRALVAPAGIAILVGPEHEDDLKDAIVEGLARHRMPDGSYRLANEFHGLIARA
jgi:hypothetical protein